MEQILEQTVRSVFHEDITKVTLVLLIHQDQLSIGVKYFIYHMPVHGIRRSGILIKIHNPSIIFLLHTQNN